MSRYRSYDELIHDLDSESITDDPDLAILDEDDVSILIGPKGSPEPKAKKIKNKIRKNSKNQRRDS